MNPLAIKDPTSVNIESFGCRENFQSFEAYMQTNMKHPNRIAHFRLPAWCGASLLGNAESAGIIQYHYVMVVLGLDQQICLFTASEWRAPDLGYKIMPAFGVFDDGGDANIEGVLQWIDAAPFGHRSVEFVKELSNIADYLLFKGESWASTRPMNGLQQSAVDGSLKVRSRYLTVLSENDARLVAYTKAHIDPGFLLSLPEARH
jgi:hypothetical protein